MTDSEDEGSDSKEAKHKRKNIREGSRQGPGSGHQASCPGRRSVVASSRAGRRFNEIYDEKPEQVKIMDSLVLDVEGEREGEKKELCGWTRSLLGS